MISFIITCYNNVEILKRCLTSFLWQDQHYAYEIILVDNNSDKGNPDQAYREFFGELPVTLVKQPKLIHPCAPSKARNIGLKLANFPWIVSLDSDIVLNPNYIKMLIHVIKNDLNVIVVGERIFVDFNIDLFPVKCDPGTALSSLERIKSVSNYNLLIDRRIAALKTIADHPHPWALMHSGNCVFKREKALAINGFDENYDGHWGYEDIDFAYRLITQAHCKPTFSEQLYCYHLENSDPKRDQQRFDKINNPNWKKICAAIPGFKEFKKQEYQSLNHEILV